MYIVIMNTNTEKEIGQRPLFIGIFVLLSVLLPACAALPAQQAMTQGSTPRAVQIEDNFASLAEAPDTESATQEVPTTQKALTEVTIEAQSETEAQNGRVDPGTGGIIWTVRSGDTLSSIARSYKVRVSDLLAWNNLADPDVLPVGTKILIREPETVADMGDITITEAEKTNDALDNTAYGWSYPAGNDVESLINQYGAYSRIPEPQKQLVLTFDCGYSFKDYTTRILDILQEKQVKATFFVTGSFLETEPDTIRRMLDEGHQVGNHTMMHLNPPLLLDSENPAALNEDVLSLEQAFEEVIGEKPARLLRPPEGTWSIRSLALYQEMGYTTLFWDLTYRDGETDKQLPEEEAMRLLTEHTRDGAVILLHAVSETNTKILNGYIDKMQANGYDFVQPRDVFP